MKHIYNYIIQISHEYNEKFKTESGMEWFGNKDFSYDRLSNRYATIVGQPIDFDGERLEIGTKVIIDPSIYYHSIHGDNDRLQVTTNTIDREKGLYSVEPQNIVLYEKDGQWFGYLNNFLGKQIIKAQDEKIIGGIITEISKKEKTNDYDVVYPNEFLKEYEVDVGDRLCMKPNYGVSIWINGKEFTWLRNSEVLAKHEMHGN